MAVLAVQGEEYAGSSEGHILVRTRERNEQWVSKKRSSALYLTVTNSET